MPSYVYILTNSAIPDRVKIGRTERPYAATRASEIGIALPGETRLDWTIEVEDSARVERRAHAALRDRGLWCNGEWFKTTVDEARMTIHGVIESIESEARALRARQEETKLRAEKEARAREARQREAEVARARAAEEREAQELAIRARAAAELAWHNSPEGNAAAQRERWRVALGWGAIMMFLGGYAVVIHLIKEVGLIAAVLLTYSAFVLIARLFASRVRGIPPVSIRQ